MTLLKWGIIGGIGVVALFFLWPWVSKLGQPAEGGTISGGIPLGGTYTEKGAVPIEISIQVPEIAPTISKDSFTLEQQALKTTTATAKPTITPERYQQLKEKFAPSLDVIKTAAAPSVRGGAGAREAPTYKQEKEKEMVGFGAGAGWGASPRETPVGGWVRTPAWDKGSGKRTGEGYAGKESDVPKTPTAPKTGTGAR